ncbi:hypothetical protein [Helicobacter sp. 11S03491-1]|uniref:hypothetical protein n=1 Tax=Helicobacter sp. 11S03491-1 TaxID=1476196 RepID=UPI000BA55525|nr:hypothetical protein [Helicobacter sp. 11S03491-1]PAF41562.1 hypothetical protein BKH45_06575 [Helicobacter sp. 11S03491-1]
MLEHIVSLERLYNSIGKINNITEFNAALPIIIKVLSKIKSGEYLLKIGNTTIETKSQKDLLSGQRYWANMSRNAAGAIVLSNLTHLPKMFEMIEKSPLKLNLKDLEKILKNSQTDGLREYRDFLLDKLSDAQNKYEFLNLGNLLFSLHKGVISFVISHKYHEAFVQIKPSKIKKQSLDFYAIYSNLGSIKGKIYLSDKGMGANIYVLYESVKKILETNKDILKGFFSINISKIEKIDPLFEFEESLLDIKG